MALLNSFLSGTNGTRPAMHRRGKRVERTVKAKKMRGLGDMFIQESRPKNTCMQLDLDTPGVSGWKAVLLSVEVH